MKNNRLDLIGQRFGKLTVIEYAGTKTYKNGNKFSQWLCQCDCGGKKVALGTNLKRGITQSCGCLVKEAACLRESSGHKKHGYHGERLYNVWKGMKSRCNNKNNSSYKHYGARGIKVCEEWNTDYASFRKWALEAGYNEEEKRGKCTLDRVDVNGDYCPENCRWVSQSTQMRNTRCNRMIEYDGEIKSLSEWADILGVSRRILYSRIYTYHQDIDKAFTSPVIDHKDPENAKGRSRNRLVKYNEETHTINEWASITGICADTLWARIFKLNWSIEKAMTHPVQSKNK